MCRFVARSRSTLRAALDLFTVRRFPIVITDWMMPKMNGLDLIRRIRATESDEYVYVILLTSKSEQGDLIKWMDAGADDFITKPFQLDELRVRLRAGRRVVDLEHTVARRKKELELAHDRMKGDLEAAAKIQQACLPSLAPNVQGLRFAWRFRPCEQLAGDMFNVVALDDTHVPFYPARRQRPRRAFGAAVSGVESTEVARFEYGVYSARTGPRSSWPSHRHPSRSRRG